MSIYENDKDDGVTVCDALRDAVSSETNGATDAKELLSKLTSLRVDMSKNGNWSRMSTRSFSLSPPYSHKSSIFASISIGNRPNADEVQSFKQQVDSVFDSLMTMYDMNNLRMRRILSALLPV